MCCGDPPPPPDYTPVANASNYAVDSAAKTAADQLAWAKDQYAQSSGDIKTMYGKYMDYLNKQIGDNETATTKAQDQAQQTIDIQKSISDKALSESTTNDANAAADRKFYEENYKPLEQKAIDDISNVSSAGYKENQRGRATASVAQAFDQQRDGAMQSLESFGVDPSSTRYAALDIGLRASKAAAMAAAANNSDLTTDAQARAMRADAINVGRGYSGAIAQTYGTAINAEGAAGGAANSAAGAANGAAGVQFGSGASGAGLYGAGNNIFNSGTNAAGVYGNLMGSAPQWAGLGNQAIQTWGNTLHTGYGDQMAHYNSSSGLGGILGGALGFASSIPGLSKGGVVPGYAEGGAIPTGAPAEQRQGVRVPVSMSPSRGAIPDDVPARLQPDEFVVPADVLKWKGEEFFQNTIKKSREARQEAPARATPRPALNVPPAFISGPAMQRRSSGAIPISG